MEGTSTKPHFVYHLWCGVIGLPFGPSTTKPSFITIRNRSTALLITALQEWIDILVNIVLLGWQIWLCFFHWHAPRCTKFLGISREPHLVSSLSGPCMYRGCKWGVLYRHFDDYSDAELISDLEWVLFNSVTLGNQSFRQEGLICTLCGS